MPTAIAEISAAPNVSAGSAVLMHSGGEIVFSRNADERRLIASTTKIMTAIVTIENCSLDETVLIKPECCGIEGSSMYLKSGEKYTVRELLCGLMLVSGNDAAAALALHTSGSIDAFVELMNRKAKNLGMVNTSFANPHGLDAEGHYSTAADMAKLMCYCMENESFAEIAGLKNVSVGGQTLVNHNKLLSRLRGCTGGKTGFTEAAGRCLVSSCEREGTRFICVTLSAPDDWNDHQKLYDWAFTNFENRLIEESCSSFDIPLLAGVPATAKAACEKEIRLFLPKEEELEIICELPSFVFAPVRAGECAGRIIVLRDGEKIAEEKLVFEKSIAAAGRASSLRYILEPV